MSDKVKRYELNRAVQQLCALVGLDWDPESQDIKFDDSAWSFSLVSKLKKVRQHIEDVQNQMLANERDFQALLDYLGLTIVSYPEQQKVEKVTKKKGKK